MPNTSAILLAGGRGTRLSTVVTDRPKVLAPVAGRPFLSYLLDQVADSPVTEVLLSTGFMASTICDTFGEAYGRLPLRYVKESHPLGTGGAVAFAAQEAEGDVLLVMNGDSYVGVDLADVYEFHRRRGNDATLVLVEVPDASRFGSVTLDDDQRILAFNEKCAAPSAGAINGGIYLITRELVDRLPPGASSLEREVLPAWIRAGWTVRGYLTDAPFIDIGVPESYDASHAFMEERVHA